jgi:hypothetical protein
MNQKVSIKREEIVKHIESYAQSLNPLIKEGVEVIKVRRGDHGIFELGTAIGDYTVDRRDWVAGAFSSFACKIPKC